MTSGLAGALNATGVCRGRLAVTASDGECREQGGDGKTSETANETGW
jgi:hypothetical protein